jgi:hypothetical protein
MFHPSRWSLGLVITKDSLNINNPSLSSFELSFKRERERERERDSDPERDTKKPIENMNLALKENDHLRATFSKHIPGVQQGKVGHSESHSKSPIQTAALLLS